MMLLVNITVVWVSFGAIYKARHPVGFVKINGHGLRGIDFQAIVSSSSSIGSSIVGAEAGFPRGLIRTESPRLGIRHLSSLADKCIPNVGDQAYPLVDGLYQTSNQDRFWSWLRIAWLDNGSLLLIKLWPTCRLQCNSSVFCFYVCLGLARLRAEPARAR